MNKYTSKEIKALMDLSKEGTPLYEHLLEQGCTDKALKDLLLRLPNQVEYKVVYELPLKDVPKQIMNPRIQGFIMWRAEISK